MFSMLFLLKKKPTALGIEGRAGKPHDRQGWVDTVDPLKFLILILTSRVRSTRNISPCSDFGKGKTIKNVGKTERSIIVST